MTMGEPVPRRVTRLKKKKALLKEQRIANLRAGSEIYEEKRRAEKAIDEEAKKKLGNLSKQEKRFSQLYACGGADQLGNATECYYVAFGTTRESANRLGYKLARQKNVSKYMNKLLKEEEELFKIEKVKNVRVLAKIRDEMAEVKFTNRFGETLNPASARTAAISAAKEINEMIGARKPKEIKVDHGEGQPTFTFNLIAPGEAKQNKALVENVEDIEHEEILNN